MRKFEDLRKWVEQQRNDQKIWPTYGRVCFQVYENKTVCGGVEFNLRFGSSMKEADMKVVEGTSGFFTVAVVNHGGMSIDYTGSKQFTMRESLESLRKAFPNGRNIDLIVDEFLAE